VEAGGTEYLRGRDRPAGGSGRVSTVRARDMFLMNHTWAVGEKAGSWVVLGPGPKVLKG
jgi:hypothetical protein